MTTTEATAEQSIAAQPTEQHKWLERLVGEWTCEAEASMGPDGPVEKSTATETVRSLGGLWVVAEGTGEMFGAGPVNTVMTLGYDPAKERFVGTWLGSIMTHLWVYEGTLDADRRSLTLECEGPHMQDPTRKGRYRDIVEFVSDDHRLLRSAALQDDGTWQQFMKAEYRRK